MCVSERERLKLFAMFDSQIYVFVRVCVWRAQLDWDKFAARNLVQPLKIIASDVRCGRSIALGSDRGSFHDISTLMQCLKGSCFLPGIVCAFAIGVTPISPIHLRVNPYTCTCSL